MYNFNNKTDVETAVNKLAAAANNGELYVIADEAFYTSYLSNPSDMFSEFVTHLSNRVPSLHLWAAAVERVRRVLGYSSSATPAPTDGPKVRTVQHETRTPGSGDVTPSPGHTGIRPEDCERCADDITHILVEELRVGQSGHDLQYRDTIILCNGPRDNLPVVSRLRARGVPVQVVTSDDDEAAIRNVALSTDKTVAMPY
nr:hypothetical protein BaRGS_017457 [Batillaria attramentaria]